MDRPTNLSIDYLDLLPDEILLEILIKTDDLETLSGWCQTSKRINNICQDKVLWKQKYIKDFGFRSHGSGGLSGGTILYEGMTWQEQYKRAVKISLNSPISSGNGSYGIIDQNGKLYISGNVELLGIGIQQQQQLGNTSRKLHLIKFPPKVQDNNLISPKVVSISISTFLFEIAAAVTEDGKAYIWGNPKSTVFGFQRGTKVTYLPREIILPLRSDGVLRESEGFTALPVKAVKIRVSSLGYIILLEDSSVYLNIGKNFSGTNKMNFKGLLKMKAIDISIGSEFYAMISEDNRVSVGGNIYGYNSNQISNIKFPKQAKQIISDSSGIMILSTTGEVYTFPISNIAKGNTHPKLVKIPEPIVQISSTESVSAALSETGKLYMWGYNGNNQFIGGIKRDYLDPIEISFGLPINFVSVGSAFTIAVSNDGVVNYWGDPKWKPL